MSNARAGTAPTRGVGSGVPYLALAVGVLAVSGASILIRAATAPPAVIAFWRLALTALLLGLPAAWRHPRTDWPRGAEWRACAASGAALALHFVSWIASLRYTTVAASVLLVTLHPVVVLAAEALLLREPAAPSRVLGAALALAGTAVIAAGDLSLAGPALAGDLLAVLGAACMAAYLLIGRRVRQRLPVLVYATVVYGAAALLILAGLAAAGVPVLGYGAREYALFLALALLPTVMGHTVFNWVLAYLPASVVSVAILGEPVGAALLAWLVLGERPGPRVLWGGAAILAGVLLAVGVRVGKAGGRAAA